MFFVGIGSLLQFIGGFGSFGLFFYGLYTLFAASIIVGLIMIGVALVGGWIALKVSEILFAMGAGAATIGLKDEE